MAAVQFRIILWGSVAALTRVMAVALTPVFSDVYPMALELYGTACQGTLALCFLLIAVVHPAMHCPLR
ncbi:hypothetical protein DQ04_09051030 [Trypanosoma grayi]|uniref:hypothetical protein n=1 Tax=Trypanosoma grayi TaxID=71804 RepID=UPI0004F4BCEE|nr:hypothetical protein DQ04_09051030 [Trypanosoma grayi]KEG07701.1 hypothetical protein DQ04_09051030 [Trypanosoma grayi]